MARGGFSGGVALDASGLALGLVTESLGKNEMPVETGYMSLLSIEPALDLAAERFGFGVHRGVPGRYSDTLFAARFSKPADRPLSSFIRDASLFVYDDNRDVFVEINCLDAALREKAVATFHAIAPLTRHDVVDGALLYTPDENPSAAVLFEAGEAVATLFVASGYTKIRSLFGFGPTKTSTPS
jgi:hypothetical protein